jgi:hypothetical protein
MFLQNVGTRLQEYMVSKPKDFNPNYKDCENLSTSCFLNAWVQFLFMCLEETFPGHGSGTADWTLRLLGFSFCAYDRSHFYTVACCLAPNLKQ